jgi:hypothetical protein
MENYQENVGDSFALRIPIVILNSTLHGVNLFANHLKDGRDKVSTRRESGGGRRGKEDKGKREKEAEKAEEAGEAKETEEREGENA